MNVMLCTFSGWSESVLIPPLCFAAVSLYPSFLSIHTNTEILCKYKFEQFFKSGWQFWLAENCKTGVFL